MDHNGFRDTTTDGQTSPGSSSDTCRYFSACSRKTCTSVLASVMLLFGMEAVNAVDESLSLQKVA